MKKQAAVLGVLVALTGAADVGAVTSAEIYTSAGYQYGRFSARIQYAPGSGVVSSFFLWKDGSEMADTFWNELDFEKLEDSCRMETNTIYGQGNSPDIDPERHDLAGDLCGEYHVYTYEWTPEYIAWFYDGQEIRRETGPVVQDYATNTAEGMQLRFNVWPGDETFGGAFDPSILPVYQYIDWVEYSSYTNGTFEVQWREDFNGGTIPTGWLTGSWESPKNNSTHSPDNVGFKDGYVILALTSDEAAGTAGGNPAATDTMPTPVDPAPTTTDPGPAPVEPGQQPVNPAPGPTPTGETPVAPAPGPGVDPTAPAPTGTGGAVSSDGGDDGSGCACKVGVAAPQRSGAAALLLGMLAAFGLRRARRTEKR